MSTNTLLWVTQSLEDFLRKKEVKRPLSKFYNYLMEKSQKTNTSSE